VPIVIAMQTLVPIASALAARSAFYRALLAGSSLDHIVAEMRKADSRLWYAPVLAQREGHSGSLLSKDARGFLKRLADHNVEIEAKFSRGADRKELRSYLQAMPKADRRLLHRRGDIAEMLLKATSDELSSPDRAGLNPPPQRA
jgi:hypothetical protein